ncbi:hypothetical protein F5Y12DRAFT_751203 [Xylaria sp. FL1777]|nr:hypothetical protein F5Y12DRAFT_751203 [Xylaria sp. FL1777]
MGAMPSLWQQRARIPSFDMIPILSRHALSVLPTAAPRRTSSVTAHATTTTRATPLPTVPTSTTHRTSTVTYTPGEHCNPGSGTETHKASPWSPFIFYDASCIKCGRKA